MLLKVQCSCGTKYSFDATPEMAATPVRFVCQSCGADNSAAVNQIIRQQLGLQGALTAPPPVEIAPPPGTRAAGAPSASPGPSMPAPPRPAAAPVRVAVPASASPQPAAAGGPVTHVAPPTRGSSLRISGQSPPPAATPAPAAPPAPARPPVAARPVSVPTAKAMTPQAAPQSPHAVRPAVPVRASTATPAAPATGDAGVPCPKHPGQMATARCVVCQKPICPKCMEQFGYLCSAYCKGQAENSGVAVPVHAGQRSVAEAREWKRVRLVAMSLAAVVVALLGFWVWYAFFGSRPGVVFSVKLESAKSGGFCKLVPPDQLILRHGAQLKRYDLKARKEVWATTLLDQEQIAQRAATNYARLKADRERFRAAAAKRRAARDEDEWESPPALPTLKPKSDDEEIAEMAEWMERSFLDGLRFHIHGQNLWLAFPDKFVRYDWESGKSAQEIPIPGRVVQQMPGEGVVHLISELQPGRQTLTQINLASGEAKTQSLGEGPSALVAGLDKLAPAARRAPGATAPTTGPTNMAQARVAQPRTAPGRQTSAGQPAPGLAGGIQAVAAQSQARAARGGSPPEGAAYTFVDASRTEFVNAGASAVQFSVKLIEEKVVAYQAMKEKPQKSALEEVSGANATAAMNEILNEWREEETGGKRWEDESRYAVKIKRLLGDNAPDWTGEVTGPPAFYGLPSVEVLIAGKTLQVFDKANKKLWESKLAYTVSPEFLRRHDFDLGGEPEPAPCAERQDTLFVFDQGVLTAFDLATGAVRWRLPSVHISGIVFDEAGMMYVSSTSASAEQLKYSQQIDVTRRIDPVLLKVDPRSGKTLWRVTETGGRCLVSGKFVYRVEQHLGEESARRIGLGNPQHARISRLKPRNGRVLWEYYEKRFPLGADFDRNRFVVLFDDEIQVLRFFSL